jgi:hypothetical protein
LIIYVPLSASVVNDNDKDCCVAQALERLNAHTRVLATHTFPYLKVPQVPMYGQMALPMGQMGPPIFNAQQAF